jgi:uncharacterized protein (DUF427 family)
MRNYEALKRAPRTNGAIFPVKPGSDFANGRSGCHALSYYIHVPIIAKPLDRAARSQRADQKRLITMKLPGPDHPITITANPKRVRVLAGDIVIADTTHALTLKEATYPAVQYVPRSDANLALLTRTDRVTHCPYKGDANYFSVNANGKTLENSIWTYEAPFPAMTEISGHLAFYPDKVRIEEVS